jgi:hypothetical protein
MNKLSGPSEVKAHSFSVMSTESGNDHFLAYITSGEGGKGVVEEPNHTTAREPGLL